MELLTLNINGKPMNDVLRLTTKLLERTQQFCKQSFAPTDDTTIQSLNSSMGLICSDLKKFDSSYKRKQFIESQPSFVPPVQVAIGTQWENERDKTEYVQMPTRKQSSFVMISPIGYLKSLFEEPHFREIYFTYQRNKHVCQPNVY